MYLTASNLAFHLISRGIITPESVVDGDFTLVEVGRRNRNFKVIRQKSPSLFVKQVKTSDVQAVTTLQREAVFYHKVTNDPQFAALKELTPNFIDYDPTRYALVINMLPHMESLAEYQIRTGAFSEKAAAALGRALGKCHSQLPTVMADKDGSTLLYGEIPWVMNLEQVGYSVLEGLEGIGPALAAAIRSNPLHQPLLSTLRPAWQYDSLVHGDPKWENCLVADGNGGQPELKIVDWELINIGDGAWDVGMVFKEFLVSWLLSAPDPQNPLPAAFAPPKERAVTDSHPAAREFWNGYASARGLAGLAARAYLNRSIRFTAARLVMAVLEYFYNATQLSNHAHAILILSAEILKNPDWASAELLGLRAA